MNRFYLGSLLAFLGCALASATTVTPANGFFAASTSTFDEIRTIIAIPCFIVGGIFAFFGLKLIKVIIFLCGFVPGFWVSFLGFAAMNIAGSGGSNPSGSIASALLLAVIVGIICGFLNLFCMKVAIFLAGFAAAFALIMILGCGLGRASPDGMGPIACIIGLFGGIAAIWIWEKAVIIITACLGSCEIVFGCFALFESGNGNIPTSGKMILYLLIGVVIFIAGIFYQNKTKPAKPVTGGVVFMAARPANNIVVMNVNQNIQQSSNVNNVNNSVNNYGSIANGGAIPHSNPYGVPPANQQFIPPQQPNYGNPQYQAPPMYPQQQAPTGHFAPPGGNYAPAAF